MEEYEVMKVSIPKYFYEDADYRLKSYFGKVRKGNDVDYRTPLFDERPREEILDEWWQILESKCSGMSELLEFENDLREKVGPMSIEKPLLERLDDIEAYYDLIHQDQKPLRPAAVDALLKEWSQVSGLQIRSPKATWENMRKSTSSGNPYFTKKRIAEEKYGMGDFDGKWIRTSTGMYLPTAILGWRGQEGGPEDSDVKQRVIWMMPMNVNIEELRCYQPLIEVAQRYNLVPAWNGMDAVDEQMTKLFDTKGKDDKVICTDFTKMDQHCNEVMQSTTLQILTSLLATSDENKKWLDRIFPVKYNIPMMYDMGKIYTGKHGMASGSGGTNADETLFHRALQHEAAINCRAKLNPYSQCLGDDGCVSYPGCDEDNVLASYVPHGFDMNKSKQRVSTFDAVYLRRYFNKDMRVQGICRGTASTCRLLGKLMTQERFYDPDEWGPEMLIMRSLSIIENAKWHPARDSFLEFCVKGDKYKLGLDLPGFFDRLERLYESSELAQSFGSYTAASDTGIMSWWVVNALLGMK